MQPRIRLPARYRHVLNSVAAGRRQAGRAIAWQVVATLLVALLCLTAGLRWSAAALVGGGAVTLAIWLAARVALGGGVGSAGLAVTRLLAGMAVKWMVVIGVMALGVVAWGLPPLPMLIAAAVALVAQMLALASR
ncbi:hypothetical protein [Xanthomonas sp. XNM01]|uniref:hypothetical protein n=1 Tax=Xanthomonas sp. XNM01 TaxID=2769289 RepID=UPI0031BA1E1D